MATLTTSYQLLGSVKTSTYSQLRLYGKYNSQNTTANTSSVSLQLRLYGNGGSGSFSSGTAIISGTSYSLGNTSYSKGSEKTLCTKTYTASHDNSGNYTASISYSLTTSATPSGSGTASITLPQIKRTSVIGNISNFTFGNNITITYTEYVASYTANLDVIINNIVCASRTNIASGSTLTLTNTELTNCYNAAPNTGTPTVSFRLTTKSGSTTIGTSTKTATGTIPSSVQPPNPSIALNDYMGYEQTYGGYVQGKSKVNGIIIASGSTGASVSSYSTTTNGQILTGQTFVTDVLNTSGSNAISTTITDSRGRTATTTGTYNVLEYNDPTIETFRVTRCDSLGNETDEGSYIKINATATITPLNNLNAKTFTIQYKLHDGDTWTTLATYDTTYTYTLEDSIHSGFSSSNFYDFRLTALDNFGSQTSPYELPTAKAVLDFYKDGTGVAIGKVAQTPNLFEVAHNTKINGTLKLADANGDNPIEVFDLTGTPRYDSTQSYSAGDYCIYNDSLYKCITATTGTFDSDDWSSTNIMTEIGSGGGGGGGTSNYNDLTNKPSINSVTLSGNKSLSDLGINIPTQTSQLINNSGFITSSSLPTKTSDLTNDSGFIDKDVNNLTNYSTTSTIQTNKNLTKGVEYIVGTQASATNLWTGTSTDTGCSSGALYTGKTIIYHLPVAGISNAATLNLTLPDGTTTGAKNIYRQASSTVTTTFAADCDILMVYDGTQWKVNAYVDTTNSNSIGYQIRTDKSIYVNGASTSIYRYQLLVQTENGLEPFTSTSNKTGTTKTVLSPKYLPGGDIRYYSSTTEITTGSDIAAGSVWLQYHLDLRYSFNITSTTLTAKKPVYMKMSVNADGTLSPVYPVGVNHPLTQTLPTTADGYVYLHLGTAYSGYQLQLEIIHPMYEYKNGKLREYVDASGGTITETDPVFTASAAYGISSSDITAWNNKSDFSGDYDDLTNKPTIPTVPTTVSAFTNDAGYITSSSLPTKVSDLTNDSGFITSSYHDSSKQDSLVSGTNIKTINSQSLLGSGNITIGGGGTATDVQINGSSIVSSNVANLAVDGTYNSSTNKIATMSSLPTVPTTVSSFTNDAGYITSYTETDPVFSASASAGITSTDISNWNGKSDFSGDYNDLTNKPTIPPTETVLYNDTSGTTGNITLSETSANFKYIEIYYQSDNEYKYERVYQPNGKAVQLLCHTLDAATPMIYGKTKKVTFSGTSLTVNNYSQYTIRNNTTGYVQVSSNRNTIYIVRVVGYK